MKLRDILPAAILVLMLVIGFAGFFIGEKKGIENTRANLVIGQELCKPIGMEDGIMKVECKSKNEIISVLEFIGGNNGQKEQR